LRVSGFDASSIDVRWLIRTVALRKVGMSKERRVDAPARLVLLVDRGAGSPSSPRARGLAASRQMELEASTRCSDQD